MTAEATQGPGTLPAVKIRSTRRAWLIRIVLLIVALLVAYVVVQLDRPDPLGRRVGCALDTYLVATDRPARRRCRPADPQRTPARALHQGCLGLPRNHQRPRRHLDVGHRATTERSRAPGGDVHLVGGLGRQGVGGDADEHPDLLHRPVRGAGRRLRAVAGAGATGRPALARDREHPDRCHDPAGHPADPAQRVPGPHHRHRRRPDRAPGPAHGGSAGVGAVLPDLPGRHLCDVQARLPALDARAHRDARRPTFCSWSCACVSSGSIPRTSTWPMSPSPTSSPIRSRSSRSRASAWSTR